MMERLRKNNLSEIGEMGKDLENLVCRLRFFKYLCRRITYAPKQTISNLKNN